MSCVNLLLLLEKGKEIYIIRRHKLRLLWFVCFFVLEILFSKFLLGKDCGLACSCRKGSGEIPCARFWGFLPGGTSRHEWVLPVSRGDTRTRKLLSRPWRPGRCIPCSVALSVNSPSLQDTAVLPLPGVPVAFSLLLPPAPQPKPLPRRTSPPPTTPPSSCCPFVMSTVSWKWGHTR